MMCFEPNVGAYIEMCHNYIDPAAGYLVAFNAMLQGTIAVPTEVSAVVSPSPLTKNLLNRPD